MYGLRNIFHVLASNGDIDIALEMITKKGAPSYRNMIDSDGTALFESLIPNGINESRNHHFFGDIINLFISKITGLQINPNMNDIYEVLIEPCIPKHLDYAQAEFTFNNDEQIKVRWEKKNESIIIRVDMPAISHGKIKINNSLIPLSTGINEYVL